MINANRFSPPVYIAAKRWDLDVINLVKEFADGIILGDLFCQKRMFKNSNYDLLEFAHIAKQEGLNVIYQTPVYNTTRTFEDTLALINRLVDKNQLDAVLLHDVGLLKSLKDYSQVSLWWDRFSFNRDIVPNEHLIDFLIKNNVSKLELSKGANLTTIQNKNIDLLFYGYGPKIQSFGRICYTEHFQKTPCENKILCSNHNQLPTIKSTDKVPLSYIADGYALLDKEDAHVDVIEKIGIEKKDVLSGFTAYIRDDVDAIELFQQIKKYSTSN